MRKLRVHILTDGNPEVVPIETGFIVKNSLIGSSFHWEERRELCFTGDYEILDGRLINIISVEDYLVSVIASEMNPKAPLEFLKAHAVISRSWCVGKLLHLHSDCSAVGKIHTSNTIIGWNDTSDHEGFDICNDDHCQRYQGLGSDRDRLEVARRAVEETKEMVLTSSDGTIADTRFSKHCSGHTELFSTCWHDEDKPYLQAFEDPFCDLSDMSAAERQYFLASILNDYDIDTQFDHWTVDVSKSDIRRFIREKFGFDTGRVHSVVAIATGPSGRHKLLKIEAEHPLTLGKELFIRRALSDSHLHSSAFQIEDRGEILRLHGKGWGHGVGLCQIGAARMAREGADFRQILSFYYPGTSLTPHH